MSDEPSAGEEGSESSRPGGVLESLDRLIATRPSGDPLRIELLHLRADVADHEATIVEARRMIEKLEEVIKKVTSPANRIGTYLGAVAKDTAHIVVGGADYYCNVDPRIPMAKLKKGTRVLVNEGRAVDRVLGALRGERHRTADGRARALRRLDDGARRLVDDLVVVRADTDANPLLDLFVLFLSSFHFRGD